MEKRPRDELLGMCRKWSTAARPLGSSEVRMNYFRRELPNLLAERSLLEAIFKSMVSGSDFPDLRQPTLFENELVLYQDPSRIFSLRLYFYGAGERTSVHDHTSWGVSGSAFGQLEVVRYRREDDGSDSHQARLTLSERFVLRPGETETTLPFDQGIHRTGNPSDGITLMLSVYGSPLRRLYIQRFDLESGRIQRMFPPRLRKKMLVEQALKEMDAVRL